MTTPTMFKKEGLLSTGDVARRLKVHRTTVWHWIKNGLLKSRQVTPRFRGVTEADLKAFQANFVLDAPAEPVSAKKKAPSNKKAAPKKKKRVAKAKAT